MATTKRVTPGREGYKILFNDNTVIINHKFAAAASKYGTKENRIIRKYARYIRLSAFADSFALPEDPYHIPIHGLYNDGDIREKIRRFAENDLEDSLFVMAGHSYELEVLDHWDYMEKLLQYICSLGFENLTTMEFVNRCYPQKRNWR